MLSATVEDAALLKFPLYASPKLDGIRALVIDNQIVSRNLKVIPNNYVNWSLPLHRMNNLDGELIVGNPSAKDVFRKTTSGVMSEQGQPDFTFYVFDYIPAAEIPFKDRLYGLRASVQSLHNPRIKIVPHVLLKDGFELYEYEQTMLLKGFEGVMLRSPKGLYKFGRSTLREGYLMKLKQFEDSEAEIIGFTERMHNENEKTIDELGRAKRSSHKANKHGTGTLGALRVRDISNGVEFDVGTGFDDKLRAEIWKRQKMHVGSIIKYKFFPTGSKDKPRFPVFLGFRKD